MYFVSYTADGFEFFIIGVFIPCLLNPIFIVLVFAETVYGIRVGNRFVLDMLIRAFNVVNRFYRQICGIPLFSVCG